MNEIEFPADRIDYRERDAANADDASTIRARVTPPANEPDAGAVPGTPDTPVDDATEERLKKIRAADREKVEKLLKRDLSTNSATNPSTSTATDEAVKPAAGTGKPLGKQGDEPENIIRPKPVFEKTGYDVPKSVTNRYVAHEGKFLDRKSETVHFEDRGRSLSTASEDRDVIAHMVEVAKAKNWGELQLKGSEEFRRQAWIAAELAGVPTRGFRPGAQDRAVLTAAREAMRIAQATNPVRRTRRARMRWRQQTQWGKSPPRRRLRNRPLRDVKTPCPEATRRPPRNRLQLRRRATFRTRQSRPVSRRGCWWYTGPLRLTTTISRTTATTRRCGRRMESAPSGDWTSSARSAKAVCSPVSGSSWKRAAARR
jgi:hypothetical protein